MHADLASPVGFTVGRGCRARGACVRTHVAVDRVCVWKLECERVLGSSV